MLDEEILIDESSGVELFTDQLCKAIADSEEYTTYKIKLEAIKQDEELYRQVNALRRNNFFSQNCCNTKMSYDEYHNIYNSTRILRQNNLVDEFLNAELDLIRMIQKINDKVVRAIDFECDFL